MADRSAYCLMPAPQRSIAAPWQCLDEIQQQYDALMAEGILPASPPTSSLRVNTSHLSAAAAEGIPTSASASLSSSTLTAEGVFVSGGGAAAEGATGVVGEGEPDADLDLDGDGTRYRLPFQRDLCDQLGSRSTRCPLPVVVQAVPRRGGKSDEDMKEEGHVLDGEGRRKCRCRWAVSTRLCMYVNDADVTEGGIGRGEAREGTASTKADTERCRGCGGA